MKALAMQQQEESENVALEHHICLAPYRYHRDPNGQSDGPNSGQLQILVYARQVPDESEPVPTMIAVPAPDRPTMDKALAALRLFIEPNDKIDLNHIRYGGTFIPGGSDESRDHLFFFDATGLKIEPARPDIMWRPLREVFFYQDPMLYVAHAEIHAAFFHA